MKQFWTGVIALLLWPLAAEAKPLVADLSQYRIGIDASFNGTQLLLFGARNETGDIIVAVRGPKRRFTVWRKERVAGMWINRRERHFDHVPDYYVMASSRPIADMRPVPLFDTLRIGLTQTVLQDGQGDPVFAQALIERQEVAKLYSPPRKVSFMGESLFKLAIPFPDTIPGGDYAADVYLVNDGELVSMQSIPIHVEKTGFDAWIYTLAHTHSALYGALAVLIALGMGWSASSVMRKYSA